MIDLEALEPDIVRVARSLYFRVDSISLDLDDLVQEGRIAAWQACEKHDPSRGATLEGYCLMCARYGMCAYLRKQLNTPAVSLEDWLEEEGKEGTFTREIEDKPVARTQASLSQRRRVLKMLRKLSARERAVIRAAFRIEDTWGACFSKEGVMKRHRMTPSVYHSTRNRALRRLRS